MKTAAKIVTTKEFQRNYAAIFKAVKAGQPCQVTFHRKPAVNLTPATKPKPSTKQPPERGAYAAILESLKYTV